MIASIDGSFILHRARHVCEKNDEISRDSFVIKFIQILFNSLNQFKVSKVYILWDRERSTHRLNILDCYKGNRKNDPSSVQEQTFDQSRTFLHENLPKLGFISVLQNGIEADDFAYLIASYNTPGILFSDDRDWYLNLFPGWLLFRSKANELISWSDFCSLVNHSDNPRMIYLLTKAMMGDKSDNIPGINGVGWKTALQFAPKIMNKESLGHSKKAKSVIDNMHIVRTNLSVMNPSWILHSDDAKKTLALSESNVSNLSNSLQVWPLFLKEFESSRRSELMSYWFKYNRIINTMKNNMELL